jgi:hypothetical protein
MLLAMVATIPYLWLAFPIWVWTKVEEMVRVRRLPMEERAMVALREMTDIAELAMRGAA